MCERNTVENREGGRSTARWISTAPCTSLLTVMRNVWQCYRTKIRQPLAQRDFPQPGFDYRPLSVVIYLRKIQLCAGKCGRSLTHLPRKLASSAIHSVCLCLISKNVCLISPPPGERRRFIIVRSSVILSPPPHKMSVQLGFAVHTVISPSPNPGVRTSGESNRYS